MYVYNLHVCIIYVYVYTYMSMCIYLMRMYVYTAIMIIFQVGGAQLPAQWLSVLPHWQPTCLPIYVLLV